MFSRLPMYQRKGAVAFKKDLTNSIAFSDHLNNPEKEYVSVHVAGTNGKGSTSHMIASVLQAAGYRVGLYTSPHLLDFRERIRINGEMISQQAVIEFIKQNKRFLESHDLSFFELTVGMAFDHFAKEKVDIAVVEVGLGGRLDSTNIISPIVSVITNIGYDHTQFLGETLSEIAGEKAGIIKPGVPVVIGETVPETLPVFNELAELRGAPIYIVDQKSKLEYKTDLKGDYQKRNVRTALAALKLISDKGFKVSEQDVTAGMAEVAIRTGLRGRYQILGREPLVICDTAHNREGLELVFDQLAKETFKNLHIVLGVVNDKELDGILSLFPKEALYYYCRPDIPRGLDARVLQEKGESIGLKGEVYGTVKKAFAAAQEKASSEDLIYVGGSTFVVAEMPL